jgi:hypothetical protein
MRWLLLGLASTVFLAVGLELRRRREAWRNGPNYRERLDQWWALEPTGTEPRLPARPVPHRFRDVKDDPPLNRVARFERRLGER